MNTILLASGRYFDFNAPEEHDYDIKDIAHALSMLCRFNGHCDRFYSVAEHCVRASMIVERERQLDALLHDAAEAYVAKPLKQMLNDFNAIEHRIEAAINKQFGTGISVKDADLAMLKIERGALMPAGDNESHWRWEGVPTVNLGPWPEPLGWGQYTAKQKFLARYAELTEIV